MQIQRLRNLTTSRLHTKIGHVYEDLEFFLGYPGLFTHMLPNANRALEPFLRQQFPDIRLWYDPTHTGEVDARPLNDEEKVAFWKRYEELPSPFGVRSDA